MHTKLPYDDSFFVLDFDRTLGNTDKLHGVLQQVIEQKTGVSAHKILEAKLSAEAIGQSFDTITYAARILSELGKNVTAADLLRDFVAVANKQDMLEPNAHKLLEALHDAQIPYGILTHGKKRWQSAKLAASKLIDTPHIITDIKEKGRILTNWKVGSRFVIPLQLWPGQANRTVNTIVFLDDKAVSFHHLPPGVHGIRVRPVPLTPLLPAQEGELSAGVEQVDGIAGAIKLLFGK